MPQLNDLSEILSYNPDIIVVGAGNAALCAAISAREKGAKVLICEAAPENEKGGNSHFTGGAFRFAYSGVDDILDIYPDISPEELKNSQKEASVASSQKVANSVVKKPSLRYTKKKPSQ